MHCLFDDCKINCRIFLKDLVYISFAILGLVLSTEIKIRR